MLFRSGLFIDRLKGVSKSLAALGNKLPSKDQLDTAAFIKNELSSSVPTLDLDLHKSKTEGRLRPLQPGELIDITKLDFDVSALPLIDNQDNPSEEQVKAIVVGFFDQVQPGQNTIDVKNPSDNEGDETFDQLSKKQAGAKKSKTKETGAIVRKKATKTSKGAINFNEIIEFPGTTDSETTFKEY